MLAVGVCFGSWLTGPRLGFRRVRDWGRTPQRPVARQSEDAGRLSARRVLPRWRSVVRGVNDACLAVLRESCATGGCVGVWSVRACWGVLPVRRLQHARECSVMVAAAARASIGARSVCPVGDSCCGPRLSLRARVRAVLLSPCDVVTCEFHVQSRVSQASVKCQSSVSQAPRRCHSHGSDSVNLQSNVSPFSVQSRLFSVHVFVDPPQSCSGMVSV